jgi:hypothetical protein
MSRTLLMLCEYEYFYIVAQMRASLSYRSRQYMIREMRKGVPEGEQWYVDRVTQDLA